MNFIKKNCLKLVLSVVLLVGFVFALLVVFKGVQTNYYTSLKTTGLEALNTDLAAASAATAGFEKNLALVDFFIAFASATFLLGVLLFVVLSMFEKSKCLKKWVLLACGIFATVFVVIAFANALPYMSKLNAYADAIKDFIGLPATTPTLTAIGQDAPAVIEKLNAGANQIYDQVQTGVFNRIVALVIYGLIPILFAIKMLLKKSESK